MLKSETAGELVEFLQVVTWLRMALPELVVLVQPLRNMLDDFMKTGAGRGVWWTR